MKRRALALAFAIAAGAGDLRAQEALPATGGEAAPHLTRAPKLIVSVEPTFPPDAARSSLVTLAITIGSNGLVLRAEVLVSGGAEFDEAALDAARQLVFEPAQVDGTPAAVKIRYAFRFIYAPPAAAEAPAAGEGPAQEAVQESPLREVVVRGARRTLDPVSIGVPAVEGRKVAGTEGDPIKVIENLPGLARAAFGAGPLLVWGAAPGDSRAYVDGVEVPQIFHGAALRSTVNGDLVDAVTLVPGGYGAEYGRGLGGIVRVGTAALPPRGVHGYAAADTLDASALLGGALGDRARFAIAGRYGWLDQVMKTVGARDVGDFYAIPRYHDAQLKAEFALRRGESLDAVVLESSDDLTRTIPDADPAHARSATTQSTFQRVYLRYRAESEGTAVDIVPWVGRDVARLDAHFGANPALLDERTWLWGLRASHRSRAGAKVFVTAGVDVAGSHADISRTGSMSIPPREGDIDVFGQPPGDDVNTDQWKAGIVDVAPYAIVDVDLDPLALTAGLRIDGYLLEANRQTPRVGQVPAIGVSQFDLQIEPRIAARLRLAPRLTLLAAAGLYTQPPSPDDMSSVFGTPTLGPEAATHVTFGESLRLSSTLVAEAVGFYKWMSHLAVRDPSPTPKLAHALLDDGVGRSYGLQILLRQELGDGFFGWIAYTLSRSERRDAPDRAFRLFDDDQPHLLTLVASKALGPWTFGLRLRYARGLPRTPVVGALYDVKDDVYQPIFGAQNSIRLPDFWQLDLRVERAFALGDGGARLVVYLEGLNVTDRSNGEEYVYSIDYRRRGVVTGLPAIGVLGARVEL